MGIIKFSSKEEQEQFAKEKEDKKLKWLLQIVYDAYDLEDVFKPKERKLLWRIRSEINLRGRAGPFKELTTSWKIWGVVIPMTWHLPKALAEWKRKPEDKWIDGSREAITDTLAHFFSDGDKYILSGHHYPHRGVMSKKYASLHFHSTFGTVRFSKQDMKKIQGKSKVNRWEEAEPLDQISQLPQFFTNPPVEINGGLAIEMNSFYRKKLEAIFGEKALKGDRKLLWIGKKCLLTPESHRRMANYMKNPILFLLEKIEFMYIKAKGVVLVRKSLGDNDDGIVKYKGAFQYPLAEFVEHFLIDMLKGFNGKRFSPKGAFHGNNTFNKILKLALDNPDVVEIPDLHSSESTLPLEMLGKFFFDDDEID